MDYTKALVDGEILNGYIRVIDNARQECIIITPYYRRIREIENAIGRAVRRNVHFKVYGRAGETERKDFEQFCDFSSLAEFPNVQIKQIPYLHAKAIRNEKELIISSLNFTESSVRQENLELGIYTTDYQIINDFENKQKLLKLYYNRQQYCKKCGKPTQHPNYPLCKDCWLKNKDSHYPDFPF